MADKTRKTPGSVPGRFYVDEECIICNDCIERAPNNFATGDNYAFVKKQPEAPEEDEQCQDAMDSCPTNAICDDGQ